MKEVTGRVWTIPLPVHTSDARPTTRQAVSWWDERHSTWRNGTYYPNIYLPQEENYALEIAMFCDGTAVHYLCSLQEHHDGDVWWIPELPMPPQLQR